MFFLQEDIVANISATYFIKWISKLYIHKVQSCIINSLKTFPEKV